LDSQLLRYPRGTTFKWSDNLDYSLQSWYVNTDLQLAKVAAILARRGMRVVRR